MVMIILADVPRGLRDLATIVALNASTFNLPEWVEISNVGVFT